MTLFDTDGATCETAHQPESAQPPETSQAAEEKPLRILFLDLDNCPSQLERLPDSLNEYSRIIACHGTQEPKISLRLAPLVAPALQEGRLEIFPVPRGGRNAADFALAFHAGRLLSELPATAEFVLISKDRDLDHIVDQLRQCGRKAKRIAGATVPNENSVHPRANGTQTNAPNGADEVKVVESIIERLSASKARPARRKTLQNAVGSWLRSFDDPSSPDRVVELLVARRVVSFGDSDRVVYHAAKLVSADRTDDSDIPL